MARSQLLPGGSGGDGRGIRPSDGEQCVGVAEEMGLMRRNTLQWAGLGVMLLLLASAQARAQTPDYAPPDMQMPFPLFSTHPNDGGLYLWGQYVMYQETNPLVHEPVAYRGFLPTTDNVSGAGTAGNVFIGSRQDALDVNQVTGPTTLQPGFEAGIGYKLKDGSTISLSWMWLSDAQYRATATLAAPNYQYRSDQADTFLTAFVYNFPPDFSGPALKIVDLSAPTLGAGDVYGIWNGASIMTEEFIQRFNQVEVRFRKPVYENETYRLSGVIGPRIVWLWERYRWVTTDLDSFGDEQPQWVGEYDAISSNNLYGGFIGCQQEWYVGKGFTAYLTLEATGFIDGSDRQSLYTLGTRTGPENKRTIHQLSFVPGFRATPGFMWYPIEGVQINLNYDAFGFFDTVSTPQPVDFNYSALDPIVKDTFRFFSGFQAGIALLF